MGAGISVYILGYPGDIGGANTELWHTVKLWRAAGVKVNLIPTTATSCHWRVKLADIGAHTIDADLDRLGEVSGLPGGIVIGFCQSEMVRRAGTLKRLGCRTVWAGCMNFLLAGERECYAEHGPFDVHVFQSEYQRRCLLPHLSQWGWAPERGAVIHGAFDVGEIPFRPRSHLAGANEPFHVGRLSRAYSQPDNWPAREKYPADLWRQYWECSDISGGIHAWVMGWSPQIAAYCGRPPAWATCLPQGSEASTAFMGRLHALVPGVKCTAENWPRVGLEAMAAGVPIVAEDRGGWPEMIENSETGFLVRDVGYQAECVAMLASDERLRIEIVEAARESLKRLADPARIWKQWKAIFEDRINDGKRTAIGTAEATSQASMAG